CALAAAARPRLRGELGAHRRTAAARVVTMMPGGALLIRLVKCVAIIATLVLLVTAAVAHAQEVTLSVAISMKDAVEDLGRGFMAARPGVTLRYNFGSSGELQKQIEAGAPVDLFISAAQRQMDELQAKRLIVASSRKVFARNALTVIKPNGSTIDV